MIDLYWIAQYKSMNMDSIGYNDTIKNINNRNIIFIKFIFILNYKQFLIHISYLHLL